MKVLIAGIDGYLGWSLADYLAAYGHTVGGVDSFLRRECVTEVGSDSAIPISSMPERLEAFHARHGVTPYFRQGDLQDFEFVKGCLQTLGVETRIRHLVSTRSHRDADASRVAEDGMDESHSIGDGSEAE